MCFWGSGNFSGRRVKIGALIRVAKLFLCVIVRDSMIFCLHLIHIGWCKISFSEFERIQQYKTA